MSGAGPIPLASQVGGHPGLLTTEDGSLVIKPCLPKESAFYTAINLDPRLAHLQGLTPDYLGTLKLHGNVNNGEERAEVAKEDLLALAQGDLAGEGEGEETEHIVLSNLSYPFTSPNILDIKLGTVLYDSDAPPAKRARMEETARSTTSLDTGVRLTGFQNWNSSTSSMQVTPKSYGKSLSAAQLPAGMALFFPASSADSSTSTITATTTAPGPSSPPNPRPSSSSTPITASPTPTPGLPPSLLLPILQQTLTQLRKIQSALEKTEARFVGMSLLVVCEGDEDVLKEALEGAEEEEEDGDKSTDEEELESGDELDDEELGIFSSSSSSSRKRRPPAVAVNLIDFAHSRAVDSSLGEGEEGPDLGVLKGVRTVIELVEGRLGDVLLM